ncbi:unnamed protein product [Brachionus calyciflorus]|uniref:UBX domain-containing protein n=1 Tax=Brachionus calyciflorus TaxID=104777 RepID=A0A813M531_9BILA|nr:unnamed protein product [Brachionus calyciflorus]
MANDKNDSKKMIPKPPTIPRNSVNLNSRQKFIKSPDFENEPDHITEILNTTLSPRPSSSKYQALPKIGTKIPSSKILIGFRLPNGSKIQKEFKTNDKISAVLDYALDEYFKLDNTKKTIKNKFTLLQMPNLILENLNQSLESYKIENRSMIFLIEKDLIH